MGVVPISGGRSFTNGVAFATDRHIARATRSDDKTITVEVQALPGSVLRWTRFKKRVRITPILAAIVVSAWIGTKRRSDKLLLVGILMAVCAALSFRIDRVHTAAVISAVMLALALGLVAMHKRYRAYHAAEHMAFNAYVNLNTTSLEVIATQDRYNPVCGTSMIAPFTLALMAAPLLASWTHTPFIASIVLLLEFTLWLNALLGWHNVQPFKSINHWLQLKYTTSEPRNAELEVAKAAIDAVIAAYGQ